MARPRLFVGSSREAQRIADAVQVNLQRDFEVTVWDQALFDLTRSTLEGLVRLTRESDVAVMVFFTDDVVKMRGKESAVTRDNVVFELGLFLGALGTDSVFILAPMDTDLHLPTDLAGITIGRYDAARRDKNWIAALRPACNQIIDTTRRIAPARRARVEQTDDLGLDDVMEWIDNQLSVPERQALLTLCEQGSLRYNDATRYYRSKIAPIDAIQQKQQSEMDKIAVRIKDRFATWDGLKSKYDGLRVELELLRLALVDACKVTTTIEEIKHCNAIGWDGARQDLPPL
jgi:Predicted nucleotide-binding protein containing TIR-like domain